MSMVYCENCDKNIDTDFNAEHFEECGAEMSQTERSLRGMYELGLEHGRALANKDFEIEQLKKEMER